MAETVCNFECLLTQNSTNQDSSRPYERLLENQKTEGSRNIFCLKIISILPLQ